MEIKNILDCLTDICVILAFIIGLKTLLYKCDEHTRKLYTENCWKIQTVLDRIIKTAIVTDNDINQLGIANQNAELYLDKETIKLTKEIHDIAIKIHANISKNIFDENPIKKLSEFKTKLLVEHYRKRMFFDFPKIKLNFLKFIILLFLLINPAFASDWVQIHYNIYLDTDSIKQYENLNSEKQYSYWIKYLNDGSFVWKQYEQRTGQQYGFSLGMQIMNCDKKLITNKVYVYYNKNNLPISREEIQDNNLNWRNIASGTISEDLYEIFCTDKYR